MSEKTRCSKCGYVAINSAIFCYMDGAEMKALTISNSECGHHIGYYDRYCETCGQITARGKSENRVVKHE